MSISTIEIQEPGLQTTVQDKGRYGYQRYGVPVSGAMDPFALRAANILVGNNDNDAVLELTALGPKLLFKNPTWVAITGANLSPTINRKPISNWETLKIEEDDILAFGPPKDGMRAYIAIAGGIDVPQIMGSRSTYLKGDFGGFEGRALQAGDVVSTLSSGDREYIKRRLPTEMSPPNYGETHDLRVIMGPQESYFTTKGVSTFLESTYTVSMDSDRMGYRLDGPSIEHVDSADIISDGTPFGTVQIPGDGTPIILLADRGISGGYTKIATVISADIGKLGQAMPGNKLNFESVSLEEAYDAYNNQENTLIQIAETIVTADSINQFTIAINEQIAEVADSSGKPLATLLPHWKPGSGKQHKVTASVNDKIHEFDVEIGFAE